ncbi:hypothetical protein [Saccharopolyspora hattusasensis]|uniref:hypothetical protein n=1 Tax=Saccharopolyspora hattusasensis TaxID=1128679 RepID=UPI003D99BC57
MAGVFGQGHFRFSRLVLLYGNTKLSERTAGDLLMAPEVAVVHVRAVEFDCFPVRDASLTPTWGCAISREIGIHPGDGQFLAKSRRFSQTGDGAPAPQVAQSSGSIDA